MENTKSNQRKYTSAYKSQLCHSQPWSLDWHALHTEHDWALGQQNHRPETFGIYTPITSKKLVFFNGPADRL